MKLHHQNMKGYIIPQKAQNEMRRFLRRMYESNSGLFARQKIIRLGCFTFEFVGNGNLYHDQRFAFKKNGTIMYLEL